ARPRPRRHAIAATGAGPPGKLRLEDAEVKVTRHVWSPRPGTCMDRTAEKFPGRGIGRGATRLQLLALPLFAAPSPPAPLPVPGRGEPNLNEGGASRLTVVAKSANVADWSSVFVEAYPEAGASAAELERFVATVGQPLSTVEVEEINRGQRNPFPKGD